MAQERADRCRQSFYNENLSFPRRMSVTRRLEKLTACERPSNRSDHGWQGSLLVLSPLYSARPTFFKFIIPDILFLGVHALGGAAKRRTERHTRDQSRRARLLEVPFSVLCGQKKGPGDANLPGPNNLGDAVLQITFAELLRSCSCNISPACCGVIHAAGPLMRLPLSSIRPSQSSPSSLRLGLVGSTN